MRLIAVTALSLILGTSALAQTTGATAQSAGASMANAGSSQHEMVITRAGSQASGRAPARYFTGSVRIDPLFGAHAPLTTSASSVTFEPGAHSAWHTHPAGQILIVTAGVGRVQQWGGRVQEVRPGDVIWTPPGVKHWHGAAPTTAMTHIAIQDTVNGKNVEWMEKVSDEQYGN